MTKAKKPNRSAQPLVPVSQQPPQLELFRLISDPKFTNAFDFYEAVPRFVVAR